MAGTINKAIVVGYLAADPEVRYGANGTAFCNFSVGTNQVWNDKDGNKQSRADFHKVLAIGKLGEICGQYLKKGKLVYVEGRLQNSMWTDKDGNKRYKTEIVASQMQMMGGKGSSDDAQETREEQAVPSDIDDIPF